MRTEWVTTEPTFRPPTQARDIFLPRPRPLPRNALWLWAVWFFDLAMVVVGEESRRRVLEGEREAKR